MSPLLYRCFRPTVFEINDLRSQAYIPAFQDRTLAARPVMWGHTASIGSEERAK